MPADSLFTKSSDPVLMMSCLLYSSLIQRTFFLVSHTKNPTKLHKRSQKHLKNQFKYSDPVCVYFQSSLNFVLLWKFSYTIDWTGLYVICFEKL